MKSWLANLLAVHTRASKSVDRLAPRPLSGTDLMRVSGGAPNGTWKTVRSSLGAPNGTW